MINTSSPSGVFGNIGQANYGAAKAGIAGFTVIAAQELQRYGVTVNCLAPNARTRMTEETFDMGAPPEGFDPLDPANMSPLVVALVRGRGAEHHRPGLPRLGRRDQRAAAAGRRASSSRPTSRWDADALLGELLDRFPDGVSPPGMIAGHAGRRRQSLRAQ